MTYKRIEACFSFIDIAVQKYVDKNRAMQFLNQIDKTIGWMPIPDLLMNYYGVGKVQEGERAYPPLLLFKCPLLQKQFRIKSDPALESQINDRLSFKSFLQLPMDCLAPDHCTFSRFRKRVSKKAMTHIINSVFRQQFHAHVYRSTVFWAH